MNSDREIALHDYVQSQIGKPFEYGVHDCPLFAAGALDVVAGTNFKEEMTGLWHDKKSAWKYVRKNGSIKDFLVKVGCKLIDCSYMQTGDLVLMEQRLAHEKKWHSIGVCLGIKTAIITEKDGVTLVPFNEIPNMTKVMRYV